MANNRNVQTYESFDGAGKLFGILGFIGAIFCVIFALIPCVGYMAFIPSLLALAFTGLAYVIQKKKEEPVKLYMAGMIISGVAILLAIGQYLYFKDTIDGVNDARQAAEDGQEELAREFLEGALKSGLENVGADSLIPNEDSVNIEFD